MLKIGQGGGNFREGPGTVYGIVAMLGAGEVVTVTKRSVGPDGRVWYQATTKDGKVGWVSESIGKASLAAQAAPTLEKPVATPKPVVATPEPQSPKSGETGGQYSITR